MKIEVPYGRGFQVVEIDKERVAGIVHPNEVTIDNERETLRKALENPFDSEDFKSFIRGGERVLFVVNDATRPTPTAQVLHLLEPYLGKRRCEYIVATGSHRAPDANEFRFIFGRLHDRLKAEQAIFVHDARDDAAMVDIGVSSNGTRMRINRKVMEADRLVIIGSVEPHYFAGYTGGRKSILPGLAAYDTITMNHKYALRPEARALALEGNPVHEDMVDALKTLSGKPIFSIQLVLDRGRKIFQAFAGDILSSMDAAIDSANEVFAVELPRREDIVVTAAPYPMDVDLYQSQKALDNGKLALNKNGVIIVVSKCRSGIGPDTFYRLMSGCDSLQDVMTAIEGEYQLGYHKAAKMVEIGLSASLWGVTDLDPEVLREIFIRPFASVQQAVDEALKLKGPQSKVLFLMEGSITVPMITGD